MTMLHPVVDALTNVARLAAALAQVRLMGREARASIIAACLDNGAPLLASCMMPEKPTKEDLERLTDE